MAESRTLTLADPAATARLGHAVAEAMVALQPVQFCIYLEGELQMKDWKDKDGNARKSAEITVDSVQFLGDFKPRNETGTQEEMAAGLVQ